LNYTKSADDKRKNIPQYSVPSDSVFQLTRGNKFILNESSEEIPSHVKSAVTNSNKVMTER
jgi:uncharacterized protein YlzI (FlbEa/FlbD family)